MESSSLCKAFPGPDTCTWVKGCGIERGVLVGSYKLQTDEQDETQSRTGFIALYEYKSDKLKVVDIYKCDYGVLCIRNVKNTDYFVSANSSSSIGLFLKKNRKIDKIQDFLIDDNPKRLEICYCVHPLNDTIWFSTSAGSVGVLKMTEASLSLISKYKSGENFQSLSVVSHFNNPAVAYAAYDSGSIYMFDNRTYGCSHQFSQYHFYGICSVTFPIKSNDQFICSAGFDNVMCFWDVRSTRRPVSSCPLSYSAWHIKWFNKSDRLATISAMDDGNHVLKFGENYESYEDVAHYNKTQSLVYCSDVCKVTVDKKESYRVCCGSFYDSLMHLWKLDLTTVNNK